MPPEQIWGAWVWGGLMLGGSFIAWAAYRTQPDHWRRWLDVYLLAVLGGLIGARLGYVLIHLGSFYDVPLRIPRLWYGELAWQGALIGGGLVSLQLCHRWKIPPKAFLDGMALALPLGFMAVLRGCRSVGCGLGFVVSNPEDYPLWLVGYLPDAEGFVLPHYELQMLGILLGSLILLLMGGLTIQNKLPGQRFWLALILLGLGMLPMILWGIDPAYPILDVISVLGVIGVGVIGWWRSANRRQSAISEPVQDRL